VFMSSTAMILAILLTPFGFANVFFLMFLSKALIEYFHLLKEGDIME